MCDLTNLGLRLVCYDLTSTYFEGSAQPSEGFPSRVFGYSRDHRPDRPRIVIGLLCTTDGIPIAHHVFPGNTNDASTLTDVLDDLAERFAVGRICVVADRGLMSVSNLETVTRAGFDHLLATRLRCDRVTAEALAALDQDTVWVELPQPGARAADVTLEDGTRTVVVESDARARRDTQRTTEIIETVETRLSALEHRVREGRVKDPAKIGRAAQRILNTGRVGRLFDLDIGPGRFLYHYNEDNQAYEKLLAGRYVLTTSLTPAQADTTEIVAAYQQLQTVETKFRVLKDFLRLRPNTTLDRTTSPRTRSNLCLRSPHRNAHHPRSHHSRHPRSRPRPPTPHRRASNQAAQPHPPRNTDHQQPPDHAHHPTHPPTNQNPHRHRSQHPHLGQNHHHPTLTDPTNGSKHPNIVETPPSRMPPDQDKHQTTRQTRV